MIAMAILLGLFVDDGYAMGYVDYAYEHHISGYVTDREGHSVADALVCRLDNSGTPAQNAPYGDKRYLKGKTDGEGRFTFDYSSEGGPSQAEVVWLLQVSHPDFETKLVSLRVGWMRHPQLGYVMHGLHIIRERKSISINSR